MLSTLKLQASTPFTIWWRFTLILTERTKLLRYPYNLRLLARYPRSICTHSQHYAVENSFTSYFTANVRTSFLSPPSQSNFTHRHIVVLNFIACVAFKKAAESLEKLMDVMKKELPDTMAAIRLSGMEISDLTMELSDLGQEITLGVRSSTRVV